jgi:hypothetical protein
LNDLKWLDNIKEKLGRRILPSKINQNRLIEVSNFHNARSVGLIYREKGEGFYILVKQYVKYLKAEHGIREVLAMSYIDQKNHVPHYHLHRLKFDYFTKGELNWKMQPDCDQVNRFVQNPFDILIDLEREPVLPLLFLLAESHAKFKIGYYSQPMEEFYDLMIDVKPEATFDEYVQQVNHYLTRLNADHARA